VTRNLKAAWLDGTKAFCEVPFASDWNTRTPNGDTIEDTFFGVATTWDDIALWCFSNLTKGAPVLIEGRLQHAKIGTSAAKGHGKTRILVTRIQLLDEPETREMT